jgi:Ca-activated chloride channel family protein
MSLHFASPWWLLLLLLLPVQVYWHVRGGSLERGALRFPDAGFLRRVPATLRVKLRHSLLGLQLLGELVLIVALARPQSGRVEERITSEGVDIVIALDVSGSMRAFDLGNRERLDVAKEVTGQFIDSRVTDRIGMVVFAGQSFTQCPLTVDYGILKNLLGRVSTVMNGTIPDGTAIGMAIATAANRLRNSSAKSKVIVLLTDGSNNAGIIDPLTAAEAAARVGVRIHTIGVGVEGRAPIRIRDPFFGDRVEFIENSLNEDVLKEIASTTNGQFFRATSRDALERIYRDIGSMERTKIETLTIPRYTDLTFTYRLIPIGIVLVLGQFVLAQTLFRTLP